MDAFLYLGPQDLALNESIPADVISDREYVAELQRRDVVAGIPEGVSSTANELNRQIMHDAENPLIVFAEPDTKPLLQQCLDRKARSTSAR